MTRASPPPIALMSDIDMMMAPTTMATNHHQTFSTEATRMNQGFVQDLMGQNSTQTGQELTITAIKCNCPGCSAVVVPNNFTAMEQRHDVANYRHVDWMPTSATRMENAMNVNRVTMLVILRL